MPLETSPIVETSQQDALTHREGESAVANLLTGLDDDLLNPGGPETEDESSADVDEPEASDEDQLQLEDDEEVEQDDKASLDPDGEDKPQKGDARFVPDNGKVTLDDGTVLTVAELKRNNLFQRDYTRKTTEVAEEKKVLDQHKEFIGRHAQAVARQREVILAWEEKNLPKPPPAELARTDQYRYNIERAQYEEKHAEFTRFAEAHRSSESQRDEAYKAELAEIKQTEAKKLFEKLPELRDQAKFQSWYAKAAKVMIDKYDFTPEEVNEATDSRFYRLMADAAKYHDAIERFKAGKKPKDQQVREGQEQRRQNGPRLMGGSNRNAAPQSTQQKTRQVYGERLKKSGDISDAIRKLETFNL